MPNAWLATTPSRGYHPVTIQRVTRSAPPISSLFGSAQESQRKRHVGATGPCARVESSSQRMCTKPPSTLSTFSRSIMASPAVASMLQLLLAVCADACPEIIYAKVATTGLSWREQHAALGLAHIWIAPPSVPLAKVRPSGEGCTLRDLSGSESVGLTRAAARPPAGACVPLAR